VARGGEDWKGALKMQRSLKKLWCWHAVGTLGLVILTVSLHWDWSIYVGFVLVLLSILAMLEKED